MSNPSLFDHFSVPIEPENAMNSTTASTEMIKRAEYLVKELIKMRGHKNPPFLSFEYAQMIGIQVEKDDLKDTSGLLLKQDDRYYIKLNKFHNYSRQNFSCAHEIGHTLLQDVEKFIQETEYRSYNPQAIRLAKQKERERLCDIAATELLMPYSIFSKYINMLGVSIDSIISLSKKFCVSIQSSAIRMAEVSSKPCITLLWKPWPINKPTGLRLAWRAVSAENSRNKTNYVPVNITDRFPSSLLKAYVSDITVKSLKTFRINNNKTRLKMESKGFGLKNSRYVLSIAYIS